MVIDEWGWYLFVYFWLLFGLVIFGVVFVVKLDEIECVDGVGFFVGENGIDCYDVLLKWWDLVINIYKICGN